MRVCLKAESIVFLLPMQFLQERVVSLLDSSASFLVIRSLETISVIAILVNIYIKIMMITLTLLLLFYFFLLIRNQMQICQ